MRLDEAGAGPDPAPHPDLAIAVAVRLRHEVAAACKGRLPGRMASPTRRG